MNSGKRNWLAIGLPFAAWAATANAVPDGVSETDYLTELPVVLSVSRLAQPLDEAPGAVTVIDRDMIRLSGARHVTELLRFVPGFQVSDSFDALAPLASYHGGFNSFPNQMQVLIDGRSVYASYAIGSVAPGLQTIDLDDIERIEVLRGSNSAAYGARAFLGVVNIVTRDPATTRGIKVVKRNGENGINDEFARVGWGNDKANFRLSASDRADSTLIGSAGPVKVGNVNLHADFMLSARDEVDLRVGASEQDQRAGTVGAPRNAPREREESLSFVQSDWHHSFAANSDLQVSFSHGEERYVDKFAFLATGTPCSFVNVIGCFNDTVVDSGGRASNDNISVQHTFRLSDFTRVVWGIELRNESVRSAQPYGTDATFSTQFRRLFGNVELRSTQSVVVNVGGMVENSSLSGSTFAPRLMLNWHFLPDHTLRLGSSKAYRPPSIYEDKVDTYFVGAPFALPPPWSTLVRPVITTTLSDGSLRPESLLASEIGYLGEFRRLGLSVDLRAFHESLDRYIGRRDVTVYTTIPNIPSVVDNVRSYTNLSGFPIRGIEGQLNFRPWPGTRILFNHASIRIDSTVPSITTAAPRESDGLTLFQKLPGGVDLSVMHQQASSSPWVSSQNANSFGPAWRRLDLRVGKAFQIGATKGEIACVVQNIGSPYYDYPTSLNSTGAINTDSAIQQFERRAFLTFSLEL